MKDAMIITSPLFATVGQDDDIRHVLNGTSPGCDLVVLSVIQSTVE